MPAFSDSCFYAGDGHVRTRKPEKKKDNPIPIYFQLFEMANITASGESGFKPEVFFCFGKLLDPVQE